MQVTTSTLLLVAAGGFSDFFDVFLKKGATFLYILTHSTSGATERKSLIPALFLAWMVSTLLATPICHLLSRLCGGSPAFGKVVKTATGIAFVQILFFTLHWYVIAWGNRQLDWSVFSASLIAAILIVKWSFELSGPGSIVYAFGQATATFLASFLLAFTAQQLGFIAF